MPIVSDDEAVLAKEVKHKDLKQILKIIRRNQILQFFNEPQDIVYFDENFLCFSIDTSIISTIRSNQSTEKTKRYLLNNHLGLN